PKGFAAGDANLYRYVGNGPTDASDPSGTEFQLFGQTFVSPFAGNAQWDWGQSLLVGAATSAAVEGTPRVQPTSTAVGIALKFHAGQVDDVVRQVDQLDAAAHESSAGAVRQLLGTSAE